MPNVINKQQQIRGFLLLIASFFFIFSILGGVMYWSYTRTVFSNSDAAITQQIRNFELAGALDNADTTERKAPLLLETNTLANVWLYDSRKNLILDARLP